MGLTFQPALSRRPAPPPVAVDEAGFVDAVIAAASADRPAPQMVADWARATVDRLGASAAFIWTVSPDQMRLRLVASRGASRDVCQDYDGLRVDLDLPGRVVSSRAPAEVDLWSERAPRHAKWAQRRGLRTFAAYPLVSDGVVVAVIGICLWHGTPPLDEAIRACSTLMGSVLTRSIGILI